jgi:integrase/recombinase XerD
VHRAVLLHGDSASNATRPLEDGVDLRYVQELLEHGDPHTAQLYTHISNREIARIRNPLGNLTLKEERAAYKGPR